MNTDEIASLDFETGSYVDLRKTGVARYAEDPTTRVLCAACYVPTVGTYTGDVAVPCDLIEWVRDGRLVSAWNCLFEYYIWNKVLPRQYPQIDWPELRIKQLIDTMAVAAHSGLPLKLETAAEALPHLGVTKDVDGHRLMMQMNKPRDRKTGSWWHEDDPAKLKRLIDYCVQDVRTERAILEDIKPGNGQVAYDRCLPASERRVWEMDALLYTRGVALDRDLVDRMQHLSGDEAMRLNARMSAVTNGAVDKATKATALLKFCNQKQNENLGSLAKDKLSAMLERDDLVPCVREALELRQEAAKSSLAKLNAMETVVCADGRIRGLTQYYGAFRSGRDAGRGIQIQNFPRSQVKDQTGLVNYILSGGSVDGFDLFFGVTPMTALSSALRGCITVPKGKRFAAIDFSQIEARVTPWLAGAQWKLDLFNNGKDLYKVAAHKMFGTPEDRVSGDERQLGKVSELALSFGGGVGAFQSMAAVYGVKILDDDAGRIKDAWRKANPEIVAFWYALDKAAAQALGFPGMKYNAGPFIQFQKRDEDLFMRLPSGRELAYRFAQLEPPPDGEEWKGPQVSFMDIDPYNRKWTRVRTYGGQLCNNATQGTARDVLKSANLRCHEAGHMLLVSIHDETLFELDTDDEFQEIERLFKQRPVWAPGLPLDAAGYVGDRFRKG